jgi:hypothetical protein
VKVQSFQLRLQASLSPILPGEPYITPNARLRPFIQQSGSELRDKNLTRWFPCPGLFSKIMTLQAVFIDFLSKKRMFNVTYPERVMDNTDMNAFLS